MFAEEICIIVREEGLALLTELTLYCYGGVETSHRFRATIGMHTVQLRCLGFRHFWRSAYQNVLNFVICDPCSSPRHEFDESNFMDDRILVSGTVLWRGDNPQPTSIGRDTRKCERHWRKAQQLETAKATPALYHENHRRRQSMPLWQDYVSTTVTNKGNLI